MTTDKLPDASHTLPMSKNTLMAIFAYVGPLIIVSYLSAKDDSFVKFHIRQGLVLFAIEVVLWLLTSQFWLFFVSFAMIWQLVNLALIVFSIIGIVNAAQGNEKELPLIGGFGKGFPI